MAENRMAPSCSTFVVRFWCEGRAGRPRWRGRIEHVQSEAGLGFLDLGRMLDFLGLYGIEGPANEDSLVGAATQGYPRRIPVTPMML